MCGGKGILIKLDITDKWNIYEPIQWVQSRSYKYSNWMLQCQLSKAMREKLLLNVASTT